VEPAIRYVGTIDGVSIAYATVGEGPPAAAPCGRTQMKLTAQASHLAIHWT